MQWYALAVKMVEELGGPAVGTKDSFKVAKVVNLRRRVVSGDCGTTFRAATSPELGSLTDVVTARERPKAVWVVVCIVCADKGASLSRTLLVLDKDGHLVAHKVYEGASKKAC